MISKALGRAFVGAAVVFCLFSLMTTSRAQSQTAEFIDLEGLIDPPSARYLIRQIDSAQSSGSAAIIVRLDTPGGLGVSIDEIVSRISRSKVPIIVWIAHSGAQASSAGVFIGYASHFLAMAPGSRIGAAHPSDLGVRHTDIANARSENEAVSMLESIAVERGRSVDWADESVRRSLSLEAEDAVKEDVADAVAASSADLLDLIGGMTLKVEGRSVTIPEQLSLRFHNMGLIERLLHSALRPEFAYLLLLIGLYALIFELYNPGIGAAGLSGCVSILFGLYAMRVLPTSWGAVLLLMLGVAMFLVDLRTAGLGIPTVVGIALVLAGSALMFNAESPEVSLSWYAIAAGVAVTLIFFLSVMTAAVRARMAKPLSGADGIVGAVGTARTDISPTGQVMARGTLWRARTLGAAIPQGSNVEVKGVSGLMLVVEPVEVKAEEG